jgi:uncharacterized protein YhfF
MAREEQEVSTAEIAQALKAGYRQFKVYEKGLDMARAVLELEGRIGQLTATKNTAEEVTKGAVAALQEVQNHIAELEGKREEIVRAFRDETRTLLDERQETIKSLDNEITMMNGKRDRVSESLRAAQADADRALAQQRATGEELIRRDIAILQGQKTALEAQVKALNEQAEAFEKGVAGVRKVRSS